MGKDQKKPQKISVFQNRMLLKNNQRHGFHLVDPSPWPFVSAFSALMLTFGTVMLMHGYVNGGFLSKLGFTMVVFSMVCWWRDIVREATYEGQHTLRVQTGLKLGMILFIVSEIMFFFAFFWSFFHFSFNPSVFIGGVWPPAYISTLNPWKIPLLNTLILLSSGASVTWCHHSIVIGVKVDSILSLLITIFAAVIFTLFQYFEYLTAPFCISDGVYGSIFFISTGFHGFHVIIGTCFLIVCCARLYFNHFTKEHHLGFELAAWYWHFVDVVWLFLFLSIYWWGNK